MVTIKLLDTDEDLILESQPFPVELNSPAFSDVIPGSRVYEIKIPAEPNQKKLKMANYIELNNGVKSYNAQIFVEGLPKQLGKINIRKFDTRYFYASFTINPFVIDVGKKSLKEMPWPSDFFLGLTPSQIVAAAKAESQKLYPNANFAFPSVNAPSFYGSRPGDWGGIINPYNPDTNSYYINTLSGTDEHNDNLYALVPFLYLRFILKVIFENNGYSLNGSFVNDELMNHAIWFNNFALDKTPDESFFAEAVNNTSVRLDSNISPDLRTLFFPTVVSDSASCLTTTTGADPITLLPFTVTTYTAKQTGTHVFTLEFKQIGFTPKPSEFEEGSLSDNLSFKLKNASVVGHVDTKIEINGDPCMPMANVKVTLSGFANVGDVFSISVERKVSYSTTNLIGNPSQVDSNRDFLFSNGATLTVRNAQYASLNTYNGIVHYPNHVQNITVSQFLLNLRDSFGLLISFNYTAKQVTINWLEDYFTKTPKQLKAKYSIEKLATLPTLTGFSLKYELNENDEEIPLPEQHNYLGEFDGIYNAPNPKLGDMFIAKLYNIAFLSQLDTDDVIKWHKKAWNYPILKIGDGAQEKTLPIGPLLMNNTFMSGRNFLMPYYHDQGSSPTFEIGVNDSKLKIAYYFGFQNPGEENNNYPFATSLHQLPDFSVHNLPRISLDFHYRSIYMLKLHKWYSFLLQAIEVETQLLIADEEIDTYNFADTEFIDGVTYIRKQLVFEISNKWPNKAKATLLKL